MACHGCTRVYDARGPLTKTSSRVLARHTASFFVGQDTFVMTLFCGSHPLGPTVDRHSLVNSGARYAEDYVVIVFGLHLGGRRPTLPCSRLLSSLSMRSEDHTVFLTEALVNIMIVGKYLTQVMFEMFNVLCTSTIRGGSGLPRAARVCPGKSD